jgi:hypothetical protein
LTLVQLLSDAFENARVDARRLEDPAVAGGLGQYLYFSTSKASKLGIYRPVSLFSYMP